MLATQTHPHGAVLNPLPVPTRAGHTFNGWMRAGTLVNAPLEVTENITLVASWTAITTSPTPGPRIYTVTFNPANGTLPAGIVPSSQHAYGTVFAILPIPTRTGYTFGGWHIGGALVTSHRVVGHVTLTAIWTPISASPTPTPDPNQRTVTIDIGRGSVANNVPLQRQLAVGSRLSIASLPTPTPPAGYVFTGWFVDGVLTTGEVVVNENMVIRAGFAPSGLGHTVHNVTFNVNGGTLPAGFAAQQQVNYGTSINTFPNPTRAGYTFNGWHVGTTAAATPFVVRADVTFIAQWTPTAGAPSPSPSPAPTGNWTVTFNPHPGTFRTGENGIRTGADGFVISSMQSPTRTGYTFVGWHHQGTPFTLPHTVRRDMQIGALWAPVGTGTPARDNPQTSPVQISFMISGAVMLAGIAAYGILRMAKKQTAAAGKYRADVTRFNREKRITDLFGRNKKDK